MREALGGLRRGDFLLWVILAVGITLSSIYSVFLLFQPVTEVLAIVQQGYQVQETILLSAVTIPWQRTYYYEGDPSRYNTIEVEPGRIRVLAASCPEQIDVRYGWLSRPGESAYCLPHRFALRLIAGPGNLPDYDAIIR